KKQGVRLFPLFHGGNQEQGIRPGTENVAGNIAFVRALRLVIEKEQETHEHLRHLQTSLLQGLEKIEAVHINSSIHGAPHIINFSVVGIHSETVIHAMYEAGFIISTQSACSSKVNDTSRVIEKEQETHEHLRHLQTSLLQGLEKIEAVHINSSIHGAPHIINFSVVGIHSETVIHAMYEAGFIISTQSACSSKVNDTSRVLVAYGLSDEIAKTGLRVSLSHQTTLKEIEQFITTLSDTITKLKTILR